MTSDSHSELLGHRTGTKVIIRLALIRYPLGFDAVVASVSNIIGQYGFFLGAGAVILLFGPGKALEGRRAVAPKAKANVKKKK